MDTGALIAILDADDTWHDACVDAFKQTHLPLLTTNAVVTELFHMVGNSRREVQATWNFLRSGAIAIAPIDEDDFATLDALMARYHDRPMDYADATLVHVANREALTAVLTVDHDDFETYRTARGKRFRVMPARR